MTIPPETIRELRELLSKATAGKWHGVYPALDRNGPRADLEISTDTGITKDKLHQNLELIAAMKNNLPALLDAAERALRYEAALIAIDKIHEGPPMADLAKIGVMRGIACYALSAEPQQPAPSCEICLDTGRQWRNGKPDGAACKCTKQSAPVCETCGQEGKKNMLKENGVDVINCPTCYPFKEKSNPELCKTCDGAGHWDATEQEYFRKGVTTIVCNNCQGTGRK